MPLTACTATAGRLDVGDTWRLVVEVRDDESGELVAATVAAVVTLPNDTTAPVTMAADDTTGIYAGEYVLAGPGRHFAVVSATGAVVSVTTFTVTADLPSDLPDLDDVKTYLGESADQWTDAELQEALDAETAAQGRVCRVGAVYPADLRSALLRRVQRALAMRPLPLAVLQGDAEAGTTTVLPGRDPEVRRLEAPHRRLVLG